MRAQARFRGVALRLRHERMKGTGSGCNKTTSQQNLDTNSKISGNKSNSIQAAAAKRRMAKKRKKERRRERRRMAATKIGARVRCWLAKRRVEMRRRQVRSTAATAIQRYWCALLLARRRKHRLAVQTTALASVARLTAWNYQLTAFRLWVQWSQYIKKLRQRQLDIDLSTFVTSVDALLKRLRPHHCKVIRRVKRCCKPTTLRGCTHLRFGP